MSPDITDITDIKPISRPFLPGISSNQHIILQEILIECPYLTRVRAIMGGTGPSETQRQSKSLKILADQGAKR
jgi:hypothetical protein